MSLGLIPVFSSDSAPEFASLGEALAEDLEALEEIAGEAGLTPLGTFTDRREPPEDFDGDPEELDELLGPCMDWFEPKAGAQAVDRLMTFIKDSADAASELEDSDGVLEELAVLRTCLQQAAKTGVKFRLTLS